ncbi:MAG TPA: DUF2182 domain-containing protein [Ktedonobacterales bacterium]
MSQGMTRRVPVVGRPSDSWTITLILLGISVSAWVATARLAAPDMRLGVLTSPAMMPASGQMTGMSTMPAGLFIASWTLMMTAMMLPSFLPAATTFHALTRAVTRARGATTLFTAGYLLVWSVTGMAAYLLSRVLQVMLPAGSLGALRGGGALLALVGLYQLTPLKSAFLRRCREPESCIAPPSLGRGAMSAVRNGITQGVYCVGSSWSLMLALLLLGMMNLAWMGVIAAIIFVEKVVPKGDLIAKGIGVGLFALGILLLVSPNPLPALMG